MEDFKLLIYCVVAMAIIAIATGKGHGCTGCSGCSGCGTRARIGASDKTAYWPAGTPVSFFYPARMRQDTLFKVCATKTIEVLIPYGTRGEFEYRGDTPQTLYGSVEDEYSGDRFNAAKRHVYRFTVTRGCLYIRVQTHPTGAR